MAERKTASWLSLCISVVVIFASMIAGATLLKANTTQNTKDISCMQQKDIELEKQNKELSDQLQDISFNLQRLCESQHINYIKSKK